MKKVLRVLGLFLAVIVLILLLFSIFTGIGYLIISGLGAGSSIGIYRAEHIFMPIMVLGSIIIPIVPGLLIMRRLFLAGSIIKAVKVIIVFVMVTILYWLFFYFLGAYRTDSGFRVDEETVNLHFLSRLSTVSGDKVAKGEAQAKLKVGLLPSTVCGDGIKNTKLESGEIVFLRDGDLYMFSPASFKEKRLTSLGNISSFELSNNDIYFLTGYPIFSRDKYGSESNRIFGALICEAHLASGSAEVVQSLELDRREVLEKIEEDPYEKGIYNFAVENGDQGLAWVEDDGVWLKDLKTGSGKLIGTNERFANNNLVTAHHYNNVKWSPNGRWILMLGSGYEWGVGRVYDTLTEESHDVGNFAGELNSGYFSNNGVSYFAWTNNRFGSPSVGEVSLSGGDHRSLGVFTEADYDLNWIAFSPSGKVAANLSLFGYSPANPAETNNGFKMGQLVTPSPALYILSGNSLTLVKKLGEQSAYDLSWSTDEKALSYLSNRTLHVINLKGDKIFDIQDVDRFQWVH